MKTTKLEKLNACSEAVIWAKEQTNWKQLWDDCERGDWMLWLLGKLSGEPGSQKRKKLVLTACECVRLSLKYVPKGEKRPLKAIQTAEKWVKGDGSVSLEDVRMAAYAAAADDDAAAAAAYAAAAAAAAYAAAYAAAAAAYAAAYAAAAAAAAARSKTLKKCADIVRKHYPNPPRL